QPKGAFDSTPIVHDGRVYIGSMPGDFYALDEASGTVIWKRFMGYQPPLTCAANGFVATATIAPDPVTGLDTIYVAAGDGSMYALNANDGSIVWQTPVAIPSTTVNDYYNWASPLVMGGRVYMGISSACDTPLVRGGVMSFDQATGAALNTWYAVPDGDVGASVWSSTAGVGQSVYATTGNAKTGYGESIVRLGTDLTLQDVWQVPVAQQTHDPDFGASPTIFMAQVAGAPTTMVGACNK